MKLNKSIKSCFQKNVIYPAGSNIVIVEARYEAKTVFLAKVRIPDETLEGGASYDVVEVGAGDIDVEFDGVADSGTK